MYASRSSNVILMAAKLIIIGSDPRQYLLAIADKEIKWTEKFGKPLECDFPHNTVFPGVTCHQDYLELLKKYLAIATYLLPKGPGDSLNRPTLRHPGMSFLSFLLILGLPETNCKRSYSQQRLCLSGHLQYHMHY